SQYPCSRSFATVRGSFRSSRRSSFSRCLARMSHSRLTRAPGRYPPSVVLRNVCGMMVALSTPLSMDATVRLMPSMAMEPLYTRYASSSSGMRMRSHQLSSPRESSERNSPVPSTWPCTMWPFILPLGESGRSRLTREPARNSPRLLRSSVSGARSAKNESVRSSAMVRQTPLTAMLEPTAASPRTVAQRMERRVPPFTTVPSSSIIPVNIKVSFDGEFVGRNGMDGDVVDANGVGAAAAAGAAGEGEGFQAAQNFGAVVEENAIHHARFQGAPVELAAGLDHEGEI